MFQRMLLLVLAVLFTGTASSQEYHASSDLMRSEWSPGTWSGEHSFYDVYCLLFPEAETALEKVEVFFNQNAIHLTRVTYPDQVMANIVVSTLPDGRTEEEEIKKLLALERNGEKEYGRDYHIETAQSKFGEAIHVRIVDVAPAATNAPFPLVRPVYEATGGPIQSMSAHRLFVRAPDRFEVAVLQMAPEEPDETSEAKIERRVTGLADKIVTSLQACTSQLPVRKGSQ